MRELWYFVLLSIFVQAISDQAPGDEDDCFTLIGRPSFANQIVLMSSRNYRNLVESAGGPWIVVDRDNNNNGLSTTVSDDEMLRSLYVCNFNFSGRSRDQLVPELLVCADLPPAHRITG